MAGAGGARLSLPWLAGLYDRATSGPDYAATPADERTIRLFGVDLPVRASTVLLVSTLLVVAEYTGALLPAGAGSATGADAARIRAIERAIAFGVVPFLVVLLGFRDRPARYGVQLGDWRWGAGLLVGGIVVMTPIILALSAVPSFRDYYGRPSGSLAGVVTNNLVELVPAEFLLRGFLLFPLLRRIGPLAIVVVQLPFVFSHIGKPEIELYSTFLGGSVFAWLDWRTGSILWSALGHAYVLTLMIVAVGGIT